MKTFLSLLFFFAFPAQAVITIDSVAGASFVEADTNNNITVWGGIAGTCAATDNIGTCNSCITTVANPPQACNLVSVYAAMPITITFHSSVAATNASIQITTYASSGDSEASPDQVSVDAIDLVADELRSVYTTWGYVCSNDGNFNSACAPANLTLPEVNFLNTARKVFLSVDLNDDGDFSDEGEKKSFNVKLEYVKNTEPDMNAQPFCTDASATAYGMCGFKLGIGDSKFYLDRIFGSGGSGGAPATLANAPPWHGVALFAQAAGINQITNSGVTPQIRAYNANYGFDDNTITGLTNYTNQCVLMGNINKAQNIYKFAYTGAQAAQVCGEPSEVVGILTDKSCFISTAAFGSDMAQQVQLFRQFRNEILLKHHWGVVLVKKYYQISPPLAALVAESNFLKLLARGILYPFLAFAWAAVHYGLFLSFVSYIALFCLTTLGLKKFLARKDFPRA